jgi:dipeptidyl aminopeptidase/acylaminoacyl peptidase
MQADGTGVQRLTNHGAIDSDPSWSPDGSQITFFSNRTGHWETFVMNDDGSNQTILLDDSFEDYRASYKDDSTWVFQSNRWGGDDQIALTDGITIIQLTTDGGERADVWCPSTNNNPPIQDTLTISITAYLDTITTQQRMQTNTMIFFGLLVVGFATLALVRRR